MVSYVFRCCNVLPPKFKAEGARSSGSGTHDCCWSVSIRYSRLVGDSLFASRRWPWRERLSQCPGPPQTWRPPNGQVRGAKRVDNSGCLLLEHRGQRALQHERNTACLDFNFVEAPDTSTSARLFCWDYINLSAREPRLDRRL